MSPPLFDRVVVVDWSANATPKLGADSIWIAVLERDGAVDTTNLPTRLDAERFLSDLISDVAGPATLLGVDFSLGYPVGAADAWQIDGARDWTGIWRFLAAEVTDGPRNANNRFEVASALNRRAATTGRESAGPFWGCPPSRSTRWLTSTKPARAASWPPQWRCTEGVMRASGHRPFDCWQLLGAGSVGSQSLTGIPMLERLRRTYDRRIEVWPFSNGVEVPRTDAGSVTLAEVWPSLHPVDVDDHMVRDHAQVVATARRLAAADRAGELRSMFTPQIDAAHLAAVVREEGWVLGVTTPHANDHDDDDHDDGLR